MGVWQKEKVGGIDFSLSGFCFVFQVSSTPCAQTVPLENNPVQRTYRFLDYYVLNKSDLIYNDLFPNSLSYKCTSETQPLCTCLHKRDACVFKHEIFAVPDKI